MNERNTLTIEKLDIEEYTAAMKAVNEMRQKRADEITKAKAKQIIIDAVDEALTLAHPADLIDILHDLYIRISDAGIEEEYNMMNDD